MCYTRAVTRTSNSCSLVVAEKVIEMKKNGVRHPKVQYRMAKARVRSGYMTFMFGLLGVLGSSTFMVGVPKGIVWFASILVALAGFVTVLGAFDKMEELEADGFGKRKPQQDAVVVPIRRELTRQPSSGYAYTASAHYRKTSQAR